MAPTRSSIPVHRDNQAAYEGIITIPGFPDHNTTLQEAGGHRPLMQKSSPSSKQKLPNRNGDPIQNYTSHFQQNSGRIEKSALNSKSPSYSAESLLRRTSPNVTDGGPLSVLSNLRRPTQPGLFSSFSALKFNPDKENIAPEPAYKDALKDDHVKLNSPKIGNSRKPAPKEEKRKRTQKRNEKAKVVPPPAPQYLPLPELDELPTFEDDGKKPSFSYAQLIGMSILRSPERKLTLAQIYNWISKTFSFYSPTDSGWQNSIRHNLSLNKAFVKQERPKDDPGKGNYWTIDPGQEYQFLKHKGVRKSAVDVPKKANPQAKAVKVVKEVVANAPNADIFSMLDLPANKLPESADLPKLARDGNNIIDPSMTDLIDSDATRSASPESSRIYTHGVFQPSSPPPVPRLMRSPPPTIVSRIRARREITPPPCFPPMTLKRKASQINDSGYHSTFDASAQRLGRDEERPDRPRIKRGRAEEDIARIRHSSHDTPAPRPKTANPSLLISSPIQPNQIQPVLTPLTPATTLRPQRAAMSVSPSTNLRRHREMVKKMVGSPRRDIAVLEDDIWNSAFQASISPLRTPEKRRSTLRRTYMDPRFLSPQMGIRPIPDDMYYVIRNPFSIFMTREECLEALRNRDEGFDETPTKRRA